MESAQRERVERRLAAILAADVVGYSRLMGEDEEGTHTALKALRHEAADPKIAEHRGRIVKTTGDGLLAEFASVIDATRCAVELQREMALRNDSVPKERRIDFRIGITISGTSSSRSKTFTVTASILPRGWKHWLSRAESASAGWCVTRFATSSILPSKIWASSRSRTSRGQCAFTGSRSPRIRCRKRCGHYRISLLWRSCRFRT